LTKTTKLVLLCLAVVLPAGCERAVAERSAAQLAAKVNGTEISVRQLRSAGATAAGPALEKVIERELLVQQAIQAGLDRDPTLRDSIDATRRQLLAQAWLDKVASGKTVSREEVRAFYGENPALFAERRIYRLRELTVSAPAALIDVLRAETARAKDLDEVATWLRIRDARFGASSATLPAEQVPLGYLRQLASMKDGDIAVFPLPASAGDASAAVVQVVRAEDAPLNETQAAPLIEQFLAGRKRLELAAAEVRRLREVATIEYAGEFKRSN
jgi:EpsD family peptidyl-prolyl cis-trans isomerase